MNLENINTIISAAEFGRERTEVELPGGAKYTVKDDLVLFVDDIEFVRAEWGKYVNEDGFASRLSVYLGDKAEYVVLRLSDDDRLARLVFLHCEWPEIRKVLDNEISEF